MSTKPEPDFILRAAGLFLCDWPETVKDGEALLDLLRCNGDQCTNWQPFEDYDGEAMAEFISDHAQALRRDWQEDFDAGMKFVANEVALYIEQRTNHPLFDPEGDAMDIVESAHKQLAAYLD